MGFFQGATMSLTHSLVCEYFAKRHATKAYFAFSISKQLADSLRYLTPVFITMTGWRLAWIIIGILTAATGFLLVFTVVEPKSKEAMLLTKDKEKKEKVKEAADQVIKDEKNKDVEVKEVDNKVVIKKKKKGCGDLAKDYKEHFGLMFSNMPAMMLIFGCFFRLW